MGGNRRDGGDGRSREWALNQRVETMNVVCREGEDGKGPAPKFRRAPLMTCDMEGLLDEQRLGSISERPRQRTRGPRHAARRRRVLRHSNWLAVRRGQLSGGVAGDCMSEQTVYSSYTRGVPQCWEWEIWVAD